MNGEVIASRAGGPATAPASAARTEVQAASPQPRLSMRACCTTAIAVVDAAFQTVKRYVGAVGPRVVEAVELLVLRLRGATA